MIFDNFFYWDPISCKICSRHKAPLSSAVLSFLSGNHQTGSVRSEEAGSSVPPSLLAMVASFSFLSYGTAWEESRLRIKAVCQTNGSLPLTRPRGALTGYFYFPGLLCEDGGFGWVGWVGKRDKGQLTCIFYLPPSHLHPQTQSQSLPAGWGQREQGSQAVWRVPRLWDLRKLVVPVSQPQAPCLSHVGIYWAFVDLIFQVGLRRVCDPIIRVKCLVNFRLNKSYVSVIVWLGHRSHPSYLNNEDFICVCSVTLPCLTLYDPMDWSLPGSSVEFSRLESWCGLPFSSPGPRDQTQVSCVSLIGRQILYHQRLLGNQN